MKNILIPCLGLAVLGLISCKNTSEEEKKETTEGALTEIVEEQQNKVTTNERKGKGVQVKLESKSSSSAFGRVSFIEVDGVVSMKATVLGLSEGTHAIHIHEKADCSSDDGKSSGGHWNPTFENHGKWGDTEGYHKGDIGNFVADTDGRGTISMSTDQWCIGCGDEQKDILGKAIIVHQGADDFTSQPSGAAGARVSCGGIIK